MQEFTIHHRYEPNRLADKYLADAYEQLLKYSVKMNNKMEVEKNESGKLICKSFIKETRKGEYNRESDCGARTSY